MEQLELAYYAGLFDGEGCITLHPTQISSPNQRHTYFLSVHLTSVNEWVVQQLQFDFGGNIITYEGGGKRNTAYRWVITRNKAGDFLTSVLPYLRLKKQRAEIGLQFHSHKKRGGHKTQEYIDFEKDYKENFLVLNHRGK